MIHAIYRSAENTPAPHTPALPMPEDRGDTVHPWIDDAWRGAQTVGLELYWFNDHTMIVTSDGAKITTEFELPRNTLSAMPTPPTNLIKQLDADHYQVTLNQQIVVPRGFDGLILPHPRFFDAKPAGCYDDTPSVIPRLLNLDVSPEVISLVCRMPTPGAEHIFYAGFPVCQLVVVPRGIVDVMPMAEDEKAAWVNRLSKLHNAHDPAAVMKIARTEGWKSIEEAKDA